MLVPLALLWVLICSSLGYGHRCDVYEQRDPEVLSRCAFLQDGLETILLGNQNNIYILHETYESSMYNPPTILAVEYSVIYTDEEDVVHTVTLVYGWSSSSVYAVVDPVAVFILETGFIALTYNFESFRMNHFPPRISLVLDTRNSSINIADYSEGELSFAMESLTSQVRQFILSSNCCKW